MLIQQHIIGIVGGLGPYAHLDFERKLLESASSIVGANSDQSYPEWIVSSVPQTPDRTKAIRGEAPDPLPWLVRSLRRLELAGDDLPPAGFATIPCNTAHHHLPRLRAAVAIPILSMIERTAERIAQERPKARVGLLATTGAIEMKVYNEALRSRGMSIVTPFDLPNGAALQSEYVMDAIYGPQGIKATGQTAYAAELLDHAFRVIVNELGADVIVAGCTEIPLALNQSPVDGVLLIDPTRVLAESSIRVAYGLESLP